MWSEEEREYWPNKDGTEMGKKQVISRFNLAKYYVLLWNVEAGIEQQGRTAGLLQSSCQTRLIRKNQLSPCFRDKPEPEEPVINFVNLCSVTMICKTCNLPQTPFWRRTLARRLY